MRSIIADKEKASGSSLLEARGFLFVRVFQEHSLQPSAKLAEATMQVHSTNIAGKFSLHSFLFQKKARTLVDLQFDVALL